jgi:6-phosphogluconolactonase
MNILPIRNHCRPFYTTNAIATVREMLAIVCILSLVSVASADEIDVWIGTGGVGIYHLTLDTDKGAMSSPKLASNIKGAGFLAMHPSGRIVYSTDRANNGGVAALAIGGNPDRKWDVLDATLQKKEKDLERLRNTYGPGHRKVKEFHKEIEQLIEQLKTKQFLLADDEYRLAQLNSLSTGDGGAACVGIDKTGKVLMSAQYGGGSVSTYLLNPDGSLFRRVETVEHGAGSGVLEKRQKTSHPHWVGTSPDNRFLMVPDLGMDRVVVYELNAETAQLKPHAKIAVPPGSGPRHMKFHTNGKYAYVLNELTLTISAFEYSAADATFKEIQLIETLPNDLKDKHLNSAAEIRVHPSGRVVF